MNEPDTLKAVDAAFAAGVNQIYSVFVQGLIGGETATILGERFRKGLVFHCDAHAKTTAIVEDYFKGFK